MNYSLILHIKFYKIKVILIFPRNLKRILAAGLLSIAFLNASAADTLRTSLADLISRAEMYSKSIEASHLNIKEKEIAVQQQRMELLPEVTVKGSATYATNMPIYDHGLFNKPSQHEVIHYLYNTSADFYLNLYNGHKDLMKIEAKKLESELAKVDWLAASGKIKLEVCNLFLDLKRAYINRGLIVSDIHDQKEQLKEIEHLYTSGVVLHSDVLRIALELSKRELLLVEIDHDIQAVNQKLQFITGLQTTIIPDDAAFDRSMAEYDDLWQVAKGHAYSLLKSHQEVELKELAIKDTRANYLPQLGLAGSFTVANPQIFLYPYNDSWYNLGMVGLHLKIPISAIYLNKNKVRGAKVALEAEHVKHATEEEAMQNQLLQAYLDFKLALAQDAVCLKNVDLAKENARIIKNRYFKSSALVTDLLDADMQQLKTRFDLEAAKISIQKHYYFIEFLKGTI